MAGAFTQAADLTGWSAAIRADSRSDPVAPRRRRRRARRGDRRPADPPPLPAAARAREHPLVPRRLPRRALRRAGVLGAALGADRGLPRLRRGHGRHLRAHPLLDAAARHGGGASPADGALPGARAAAVRLRRARLAALGLHLLVVAVRAAADRPLRGHLRGRSLLRRGRLRRLPRARRHAVAVAPPSGARPGHVGSPGRDTSRGAHGPPDGRGARRRGRDAHILVLLL